MTASSTQHSSDDQPAKQPPGTGDVVVRSPALAAPWDYGPESVDLRGAQFTPRFRQAARRLTRNTPDSEVPATPAPRHGGRA